MTTAVLTDMINGISYSMVVKGWGKSQNSLPAEILFRNIPNIKQEGTANGRDMCSICTRLPASSHKHEDSNEGCFNKYVLRPELEPCMTTLVTSWCNHDTSPYSQLWSLVLANRKIKVLTLHTISEDILGSWSDRRNCGAVKYRNWLKSAVDLDSCLR